MTTVADLIGVLEAAGFRVAPPGDNTTSLPCVVVSPVRFDLQPGGRLLYQVVDVCPSRAASPWKDQYPVAVNDMVAVLRALAGSQYQFDPQILFDVDAEHQPPAMFHRINCRFAGPDLCPPPAP